MSEFLMKIERIMRGFAPEATPYIDVEKKLDIWKEFASLNNGSVKTKRTVDRAFSRLIMDIPINNHNVHFEESDNNYLRVRCNLGTTDFKFYLTFEDFIERIIKTFNNKEIEIGDKEFDDKYLIVTNNDRKMQQILSDETLKELLLSNNISNFHLDDGELFILGHRHLDSIEELNALLEILKNIIKKISS